ncbi:MAG: hypothetical protein IPP83_01175 [Flavobacteriales bacterium]|nr:hypothetical protein [Flavobacteriales bacterium]
MEPIPYRIRIGVTGHRKGLPDPDVLDRLIKHALGWDAWSNGKRVLPDSVFGLFDEETLKALHSLRSTPIRFSIHTSLAEGADRAVAKVICATEGGWLQAVLPFEAQVYEQTFGNPEAITEFRSMLALDPTPRIIAAPPTSREERHAAYFDAGKEVVKECEVLIAVWNGEAAAGKGGTAEVVEHARSIKRPILIIRTDGTPRLEVERGEGLSCTGLMRHDRFNAEPVDIKELSEAKQKQIGTDGSSDPIAGPEVLQAMDDLFWPMRARASAFAARCKDTYEWTGAMVYTLSACAVLAVVLATLIGPLHIIGYIVDLIMLLGILLVIGIARRSRTHQRWLQHRYLAERCRTAVYFFLFGIRPSITRPIGSLKEGVDDAWVVRLFEEVSRTVLRAAQTGDGQEDGAWLKSVKQLIDERLLDGQIDFHKRTGKKNSRKSNRLEHLGQAAFYLAVILAVGHIWAGFALPDGLLADLTNGTLTVFAILLPVVAGAFEGVRKQREYGRTARVNKRMVAELSILKVELASVQDVTGLRNALLKIDRTLMRESEEWLGLLVDNDVELMP